MKQFFKAIPLFFIMAILFASCSKKNEEGKMIPANALFVAHLDMNSMNKKLSWSEIKEMDWFKKMNSDSSAPKWAKKMLENPEASGIDFDKSLLFFGVKGDGDKYYIVAEGTIKNKDNFEQFNKNFDPSEAVKKIGDVNVLTLKDKNVAGWNGDRFAYVMNSFVTAAEMYDINNNSENPADLKNGSANLGVYCASLFNLKSDSSLASNSKFGNLMKEKGDMHFWNNNSEIIKNVPMGMLGMLKLDIFFKENYGATTINFEDGKIEMDQKFYSGKELTDFLKKYKGSKINSDMVKNIPSQNVMGLFAMNFKPEAIQELIKLTGTDGFVNMFLKDMGVSLDDLSKANNGDMMISISDVELKPDTSILKTPDGNSMMSGAAPGFNFLFSMSVKDKASFQKISNALQKVGGQMGADSLVNIQLNDKYFTISNHKDFADKFMSGTQNNQFDFVSKLNSNPMGFYLDLHKLFTVMSGERMSGPEVKSVIDQNLKMWDKVSMTAGDMKNDAFNAHSEMTFIDQKTNSLKQLNSYLNEVYKYNEARKENNPTQDNLDSILTPPTIDTVKFK